MALRRGLLTRSATCLVLALAGCDVIVPADPVQTPRSRPASLDSAAASTSERSAALRTYLTQVQTAQLSQDLLRRDGGGPDTPFTADMLARNFRRIVFYNEYPSPGVAPGASGRLRRWDGPVRFGVEFGPSVPQSQRDRDRREVAAYTARLANVTGHPISVSARPNFLVFFVSEDDRAATIDRIATRLPGLTRENLAIIREIADDVYCAVAAYATGRDSSTYSAAVAVIRAENPDLLRLSCIHEELAQGLGLANDSPAARPSIFNDDDEFALLTTHDEKLLAMLYDPRLRTGMTYPEAAPVIRIIAREQMGETL